MFLKQKTKLSSCQYSGIDPDKINIEVGDDYLSMSGKVEKETKDEDKKGKVYRYERECGEFRREFSSGAS